MENDTKEIDNKIVSPQSRIKHLNIHRILLTNLKKGKRSHSFNKGLENKDKNKEGQTENKSKSPKYSTDTFNSNMLLFKGKNDNDISEFTENSSISREKQIFIYLKKNYPYSSRSRLEKHPIHIANLAQLDLEDDDDYNKNIKDDKSDANTIPLNVPIDKKLFRDLSKDNIKQKELEASPRIILNQKFKKDNIHKASLSSNKKKYFPSRDKYIYFNKIMKASNSNLFGRSEEPLNEEKVKNIETKPEKGNIENKSENKKAKKSRSPKNKKVLSEYINRKNRKLKLNEKNNLFQNKEKDKTLKKKNKNLDINDQKTDKIELNIKKNDKKEKGKNIIKSKINENKIINNIPKKIVINQEIIKNIEVNNKNPFQKKEIRKNNLNNLLKGKINENVLNNKKYNNKINQNNEKKSINQKNQIMNQKDKFKNNIKKENDIKKENKDNNIIDKKNENEAIDNNLFYFRKFNTKINTDNKNNNDNVDKLIKNNNNTIYVSTYHDNNLKNKNSSNIIQKIEDDITNNKINLNTDKNNISKNIKHFGSTDNINAEKIKNSNQNNNKNKTNIAIGKDTLSKANIKNNYNFNNKNICLSSDKENKKISANNNNNKIIIKDKNSLMTDTKIANEKIVKNKITNNIISSVQHNLFNVNIKVNPKREFIYGSKKANNIKSHSNLRQKEKDILNLTDKKKNSKIIKINDSKQHNNLNTIYNRNKTDNKKNSNIKNSEALANQNKKYSYNNVLKKIDEEKNSNQTNINNLAKYSNTSKIIIQTVVIENNAINNNIIFNNNIVSPNNYLINPTKTENNNNNFDKNAEKVKEDKIKNNIYIRASTQKDRSQRILINPVKETILINNNFNTAKKEETKNIKENLNFDISLNNTISPSRNIRSSEKIQNNSNLLPEKENNRERLNSCDQLNRYTSEIMIINPSNKERRMNYLYNSSESVLANSPKVECSICHKLVETYLIKIHTNWHPTQVFNWLYLGTFSNATDLEELKRIKIKYVLNCASECINRTLPTDIIELRLKIIDDVDFDILSFIEQSNDFINKAKLSGGNILIHCKMGRSRSVSLVIAYLIKYHGYNFNSALNLIKERRNQIGPNKGFIEQLKKYENLNKAKKL